MQLYTAQGAQPLYERYRPRTLEEVVGQPKAVATVARLLQTGAGGRAVWLSGGSGCGKTTIARIIAASVADEWFTTELDSGTDLTAGVLSELRHDLRLYAGGKGGRAVIVNEAHSIRADVLDKLKGVLESIPAHVVWCFTTTREDEERLFDDHIGAGQLLSRCLRIRLTSQGLAQAFAERVRQIAQTEGLDGQPVEAYVKLARRCNNNARAMLVEVESGCMMP